jgi:hypothetical protein
MDQRQAETKGAALPIDTLKNQNAIMPFDDVFDQMQPQPGAINRAGFDALDAEEGLKETAVQFGGYPVTRVDHLKNGFIFGNGQPDGDFPGGGRVFDISNQ